jgi:hypothetical protein
MFYKYEQGDLAVDVPQRWNQDLISYEKAGHLYQQRRPI